MKVGIYYDTLVDRGGAERVILEYAHFLGADIITSKYNSQIDDWVSSKLKIIELGNLTLSLSKPFGILFEAPLRFYLYRKKNQYDVNVFFGSSAIYAADPGSRNVYYCFTPNRILFNIDREDKVNLGIIRKIVFGIYKLLFKRFEYYSVTHNFSRIIAQSKVVQARIKSYYKLESTVVHSPLQIKSFRFDKIGDYYMTVGRLFPAKRIDIIIDAFNQLPDRKLIIVGDGPEKSKLSKIVKNKNVEIISNVTESELIDLYANCFATIYIPSNEDYGLVPIESMASGKMCIAANEGGCRESILNGKTGYLIDPTTEALVMKIRELRKTDILRMKDACFDRARQYDIGILGKQLRHEIDTLYKNS